MGKQWRKIKIHEGCELKTVQQLCAIGIRCELPMNKISVDGLKLPQLTENGHAFVLIDDAEKQEILNLPYVTSIE